MSMIKILYCVTKGNWGGAQRYVYDLATNMDKNIYEINVLCGEGDELPDRLFEKGIKVIKLSSLKRDISIKNEFKSFIEIYKIFKKEKPDIIHLNSSKMGGIGAFIGRIIGIKNIIFTAHGFAFNEKRSLWQKWLLVFFHHITIILTHKTIIVSEKTKKDIDYLPFIKNKLIKIYNGIDTNLDFYDKENAKNILLKGRDINIENKTVLMSIGELHKNKGYDLFIPYLKEINKDFIYLIIGEGEERNNIVNIIKDNNLKDKVFLLSRIEYAYKYIKACDVFILPSRTEAFPYVLLESGLGNSTVIASKVGGIPEVIEDNKTGLLFDLNNKEETINKINSVIENKDLRNNLSKNIYNRILSDFSLEKMIQETVKIYTL